MIVINNFVEIIFNLLSKSKYTYVICINTVEYFIDKILHKQLIFIYLCGQNL